MNQKLPNSAERSDSERLKMLQRDAEKGIARAQRHLANRFLRGRGVPSNPVRGAEWMRRAAEQGLPAAQRSYGELLEQGIGVTADLYGARQWYEAAAMQGDPTARRHLERLRARPITGL
jgi:TPR repeat protein